MMKKTGRHFWAMIAGLLLAIPVLASGSVFSTFDGKPASIDDYIKKDKWLLVMIWASDCHICNREAHAYADFHFKHEEKSAQVLGISMDGQAKKKAARLFIQRHEINFPNLIGEPAAIANWFEKLTGQNWMGTPTMLLYSPEGKLRVQQIGAIPLELVEKFIQRESARSAATVETAKQGQ